MLIGTATDNGAKLQVSGQIRANNVNLYVASAARGGLYTYNQVIGSGTDYSVGLFSEGEVFISSGGTTTKRLTITSSGNVGIGTTNPRSTADVNGILTVGDGNPPTINLYRNVALGNNAGFGSINFGGRYDATNYGIGASISTNSVGVWSSTNNGGNLRFATTPQNSTTLTERIRITSEGDFVKKGTIADLTLGLSGAEIFFSRNNANYIKANGGTSCDIRIISNTNGVVLSNGATSWGSLSDENSKDIIEPIENACYKLSQVRTVIGKYKTDDEDKRRLFLIAQDIEKVYPEAVFKIKNENKEESLGLNYQDLIPVLVKAIQEQQVQIQELKNN